MGTEEYIAPEVVNGVGQSSAVDWWTLGILIYEMLTGTTPFKGSYTDETFSNIVHEQLRWPDDINVSTDCKNLVKKLLRREADKRLGAENGASDIKRSKWFKDFNFALIRVSLASCGALGFFMQCTAALRMMLTFAISNCLSLFSFHPHVFPQNETPPIIPKIRDPRDLSQYRRMPEDEDGPAASADSSGYTEDSNPENPFVNFNMRRNESLQRQY